VARYLADTSALSRFHNPEVFQRVEPLYLNGRIATCGVIDLRLLVSARTGSDHEAILADRRLLPRVACGDAAADRAIEVQGVLARTGRHRVVSLSGLLIAAAAEQGGLTLLHYDAEFDLIGEVTAQPMEWIVPRGSVP
jgi:predicted nucleic acid-binding protein